MYVARVTELLDSINTNLATLVSRGTPYTLTFTDDENTTLAASLIRKHEETLDLDSPVTLTTGATVFVGDIITFAATAEIGYTSALKINSTAVELTNGAYTMVVAGNVTAACVGEQEAGE